jgi:hypothetical protein
VDVTLHSNGGGNESLVDAYGAGSVKQVPGPVSPRSRSRVLEVSCRYRSHSGKHARAVLLLFDGAAIHAEIAGNGDPYRLARSVVDGLLIDSGTHKLTR